MLWIAKYAKWSELKKEFMQVKNLWDFRPHTQITWVSLLDLEKPWQWADNWANINKIICQWIFRAVICMHYRITENWTSTITSKIAIMSVITPTFWHQFTKFSAMKFSFNCTICHSESVHWLFTYPVSELKLLHPPTKAIYPKPASTVRTIVMIEVCREVKGKYYTQIPTEVSTILSRWLYYIHAETYANGYESVSRSIL